MGLSERVWSFVNQTKEEFELAIEVGMTEGRSAADLSRDVRQALREPAKLFRRVRDKETGQLRLSKAAQAYNPGRGVYRSSFKNALRLTATENNMAYRRSDHERWQNTPWVLGIEVSTSTNNHEQEDICDELAGKYPKDFVFVGWHPFCRCFATPILPDEEEYDKYEEALIAGEDVDDFEFSGRVEDLPENFTQWCEENAERIENASSSPYFLRDNFEDGDPSNGPLWEKEAEETPVEDPDALEESIDEETIVELEGILEDFGVESIEGIREAIEAGENPGLWRNYLSENEDIIKRIAEDYNDRDFMTILDGVMSIEDRYANGLENVDKVNPEPAIQTKDWDAFGSLRGYDPRKGHFVENPQDIQDAVTRYKEIAFDDDRATDYFFFRNYSEHDMNILGDWYEDHVKDESDEAEREYFEKHGEIVELHPKELIPTQPWLAQDGWNSYVGSLDHIRERREANQYGEVIALHAPGTDQYYLWNGHHRVVGQILDGNEKIKVRVVELEDKYVKRLDDREPVCMKADKEREALKGVVFMQEEGLNERALAFLGSKDDKTGFELKPELVKAWTGESEACKAVSSVEEKRMDEFSRAINVIAGFNPDESLPKEYAERFESLRSILNDGLAKGPAKDIDKSVYLEMENIVLLSRNERCVKYGLDKISTKMPEALFSEKLTSIGVDYTKTPIKKDFFDLVENFVSVDFGGTKAGYAGPPLNKVFLGLEDYRNEKTMTDSAYARQKVIYHEFGHAISKEKGLAESPEVKALVKRSIIPESRTKELDELIYDVAFNEKYKTLASDVGSKLGCVSDTIESLIEKHGNIWIIGHPDGYWNESSIANEIVAHMFENYWLGNDVFEKILPDLYAEMNGVMNKLMKR